MEGAALPICSPFGLTVAMLVFRLALLLYNTKCCGVLMRALTHIHQAKQPSYVVLFFYLSKLKPPPPLSVEGKHVYLSCRASEPGVVALQDCTVQKQEAKEQQRPPISSTHTGKVSSHVNAD